MEPKILALASAATGLATYSDSHSGLVFFVSIDVTAVRLGLALCESMKGEFKNASQRALG